MLSILPYDRALFQRHQDEAALEQEKERTFRMANILGFSVVGGAEPGEGLGECLMLGPQRIVSTPQDCQGVVCIV